MSANLLNSADEAWFEVEALLKPIAPFPPYLYHYTPSIHAVSGMIEKQEFFLSPHDDVNDPEEVFHGLKLALEVLESPACKNIESRLRDNLVAKLQDRFSIFPNIQIFFLSFSTKEEDVSQWRSYGDGGNGYCLGFDTANLVARANDHQDLMKPLIDARPVIYEDTIKKNLIAKFFSAFDQHLRSASPGMSDIILQYFLVLAAHFKDQAYFAEHEWRLILYSKDGKSLKTPIEEKKLGNLFREKMITKIPGHRVHLDAIHKIICGPKQNMANVRALQRYLNNNQSSHILAKKSRVPMR